MLVVDQLKRITIPEIHQNAWFNTNLPPYLKPLPFNVAERIENIDDSIVVDLEKVCCVNLENGV
jgi:carbon catabolite-derepressing protein kinase